MATSSLLAENLQS